MRTDEHNIRANHLFDNVGPLCCLCYCIAYHTIHHILADSHNDLNTWMESGIIFISWNQSWSLSVSHTGWVGGCLSECWLSYRFKNTQPWSKQCPNYILYQQTSSDVMNWLITCAQKPCPNFQLKRIATKQLYSLFLCHFNSIYFYYLFLLSAFSTNQLHLWASERTFSLITFTFQN